jgi:GNAT superfamily N-acetyltransferase
MVTIRPATVQDIDSLVGLFSSRSEYVDPFSQKAAILDPEHGLRSFKVALIAESAEGIAGFVAGQDSTLFPNSQVAQGTDLFVHHNFRNQGFATLLTSALDEALMEQGYLARLDFATTANLYSQMAGMRAGALPVGFLPDSLPPSSGRAGRESLVPMISYLTEEAKEQALLTRMSFSLPFNAANIAAVILFSLQETYPSAFRAIDPQAPSSRMSQRGENFVAEAVQRDVLEQPMLPLDVLPLSDENTYSRVKSLLEAGVVPVGFVPLPQEDYLLLQPSKLLLERAVGAFTSTARDAQVAERIQHIKKMVLARYLSQ